MISLSFDGRPYQEGDEKGIVELLNLVWNGWPHLDLDCSPLEHWRWKFIANPIQKRFINVAENDGRIIGCHHAIPVRIKVGNEILLCTTGADLAVHPNYRGLGVTKKIGRELSEGARIRAGVKFDYHITGNPILIKSFERRKPRFPFDVSNLVRIVDIEEHLGKMPVDYELITKIGYSMLKVISDLKNTFKGRKIRDVGFEIREGGRFDARYDELWHEVEGGYRYIVERRSDYLNWRYCDSRAGNFKVKFAEDRGMIVGYSVVRINRYRRDYPIGYIVDLLAIPGRLGVVEALAANAVNYFDNNDVNIVIYQVVKGHPYGGVMKGLGFLDSRIPLKMYYNPLGNPPILESLREDEPSKVYVSWGDHDVLPVSMPTY